MQNSMIVASALTLVTAPQTATRAGTSSQLVSAVQNCQQIREDAARLACYDRNVSALAAASARGDVTVVDRTQMREVRRSLFGFSVPRLPFFSSSKDRDVREEPRELIAKLATFHDLGNGFFRFTLDEPRSTWEIDRSIGNYRAKDRRKSHNQAWDAGQLFRRDWRALGTRSPSSLGSGRAPFRLKARLGIDIGLLPLDAPIAQLVQRNGRAGHRANDVVAVATAAGTCPADIAPAPPCRLPASASPHSSAAVEQAGLGRDVGSARLALNRRRAGAVAIDRRVHRAVAKCSVSRARRSRRPRAGQRLAVAAGDSRRTLAANGRSGWTSSAIFHAAARRSVELGDPLVDQIAAQAGPRPDSSPRARCPRERRASAAAVRQARRRAALRARRSPGARASGRRSARTARAPRSARRAGNAARDGRARRAGRTARHAPAPRSPPPRSGSARAGRRRSRSAWCRSRARPRRSAGSAIRRRRAPLPPR